MRADSGERSSSTMAIGALLSVSGIACRRRIDRKGEGVNNQHQHDRIACQAAQFLDAQMQNIGQRASASAPAFSENATDNPSRTGTASARAMKDG